jgi:hypothetical protein
MKKNLLQVKLLKAGNYTRLIVLISFCMLCSVGSYAQNHLLLSEITLAPDSGEFIEIYNPTSNAISLDNYYLADNAEYDTLPSGTTNVTASDFIVRFPAGYNIQPNQALVIAMKGDYFSAYSGITPAFEVISQGAVPDMLAINLGSAATLTNTGEGVILFYWDGSSDLVADVDMVNAGAPSIGNQIASKTGLSVDGPDGDVIASSYLTDVNSMPLQVTTPGSGKSTKRIYLEGSNETHGGGNGITGDDETSENILVTWDSVLTAPTPGISDIILGIASFSNSGAFSIYPNPSKGQLTIYGLQFSLNAVEIFNTLGEKVYNEIFTASQKTINSKLVPGIYFVKISNGNSSYTQKLIMTRK